MAHTDIGLYKEDQRYTLHVALKDRAGNPAAGIVELQQFGRIDPQIITIGDSGTVDLRLPQGVYSALTYLDVPGSHGPDSLGLALLGNPQIDLDHDQNLTLDARKAIEVKAVVPRTTEDRMLFLDWYRTDGADSTIGEQYMLPSKYDTMYALPTRKVTKGSFEFESRWRKAYPMLTVADHGKAVSFLGQAGSSLYRDKGNLATVYAGDGSDYAGMNAVGKAAIVTRADTVTASQRAALAAAAGAKLLIVVNDQAGKLLEWVGQDDGTDSAIPVITVTARTGAALIAEAGKSALRVVGTPDSPYAYDLVDPHPGQIPSRLTYRPKPNELATVNMKFYGSTPYPSGEFRWDYRPYRIYGTGLWLRTDMPGVRTDYVSAQPGTTWAESAVTGPNYSLVSSGEIHALHPGSNVTSDWFAPVVRPRDGGGFWSSQRDSLSIQFNVQPWADSGVNHAGYLTEGDDLNMKIYQDGTLVSQSAWASGSLYPVPTVTSTYKLDLHASRDPAVWRLSPKTHTMWTVVSEPVTDPNEVDLMPLMQLDYNIHTDLAGNAPGGWQTLGMTASHLPGAVGTGKIVGGSLSVSYDDGATWHKVTLTKTSTGHWTARFMAPAQGFVSIKSSAWDSRGNNISENITRAYAVK